MPRNYQKKGRPGGRPPIDDERVARAALFAFHVEGHELHAVLRWAAQLLMQQRKEAAEASPETKRDGSMSPDAAKRRVRDIGCKLEGPRATPLIGLPPGGRAAGMALAEIARRDGYAAARATLLQLMTRAVFGPVVDKECIELIEAWITETEMKIETEASPQ